LRTAVAVAMALAFGLLPVRAASTVARPPAADPAPASPGSEAPASGPATPAEACGYRCTPSYRETLEFVNRLARLSPLIHLSFFGETAEGYPVPLVVAARERRFEAEAARESGLPVVLVFSGIHAGEIDGKDASLALLRDIATGRRAALLDRMILLVVPIYNVDGHERRGPYNRLAQDGPEEGMGFRTNGRGLDLNRDFVKLESPETTALVGCLFRAWRPHVVVDCHVTDGMDFQYEMTYFAGESAGSPPPLLRYVTGMMGAIQKGLDASGHKAAPWGDLDDPSDPNKGLTLWAASPRYSTSYFESRNRVSILAEAHAYKPFGTRVAATFEMIRAILEHVAEDPKALLQAVSDSEAQTVKRAATGSKASFALRFGPSREPTLVDYAGIAFSMVRSEVTGLPRVVWSRDPVTWKVPIFRSDVPVKEVRVPRGYLLSRAYEPLAEKAFLHGLRVERTLADADLDVEVFRVSRMTWADVSYQGHHAATAEGALSVEKRRVPAGTYWIPLDQPDASIAIWMFEAESPEGFLAWNYFDNVLEEKMIVEDHVVEAMAEEALKDPNVRAEYERTFGVTAGSPPIHPHPAPAADPNAPPDPKAGARAAAAHERLMWFYGRSPWADREVGVYPVFRLTGDLAVPTAPWSPPGLR